MEDTNHPVYNLLQQKLNEIDQELAKPDIPEEVYERLCIWKDLFTYVNMVLHTKRFPHVPKRILNDLQNNISNFNINIAYNPRMTSTVLLYDGIVAATQKIPVITDKGTLGKGLSTFIESFNNQAENSITNFSNESKKAIENWKIEKEKLNSEITKLQEEKKTLSDLLETLKADIILQRDANQKMVSELQLNFTDFKKEKEGEFKSQKGALDKIILNLETTSTTKANEIIKALEIKEKEVEKLWGIIGKAAISGQAQSYATRACRLAHFMMFLTLLFMTFACYNIYQLTDSIAQHSTEIQMGMLLFRLLAAAIFFAPAFYCANVAKRQRDREFQLRDFEVKTAALEPFVERMALQTSSKIEKDKMKIDLTKTFFDKEFAKKNKQHGDILISADMRDSLEKIGKIFNSQNAEKK